MPMCPPLTVIGVTITASVPSQRWLAQIPPKTGLRLVSWDFVSAPDPDIEFAVAPYQLSPNIFANLRQARRLRTVQLLTAGYDHVLPYLPPGVRLCSGRGIHDSATAELAVTLTLAAQRNAALWFAGHQQRRWLPAGFELGLADVRVLIVGYGAIGKALARRLVPFEADVTVVASRARSGDDVVAQVHGVDELPELLPHQQVVILIVPLTAATTGLVDADFLAQMPDGALLVNVARGKVVDTQALLAEVQSGRLRAALDVTDPEPLPDGHLLWSTPGVLISPHVGGFGQGFYRRAKELVIAQLDRLASGADVENVVAGR